MGALRILLPILAIVGLYYYVRRNFSRPAAEPSCATCRHCNKVFEDGTLCAYGDKEVFKKPVHVKNCTDYSPRR